MVARTSRLRRLLPPLLLLALVLLLGTPGQPVTAQLTEVSARQVHDATGLTSTQHLVLFVVGNECSRCAVAEYPVMVLAEAFRGKPDMLILKANMSSDATGFSNMLPIPANASLPFLFLVKAGSLTPTLYKGGFRLAEVSAWLHQSTTVQVPEPLVQTVDTERFDRVVIHPRRHVLVEFFAPWSAECKALIPVLELVAKSVKDEKSLLLVKVDASSEPALVTRFNVGKLPTLMFFERGVANPGTVYDGPKTAAAILDMLNQQAGTHRMLGGSLKAIAGRVSALDAVAGQFLMGNYAHQQAVLEKVKILAKPLMGSDQESAQVYITAMKAALNSADSAKFLHGERKRVETNLAQHPPPGPMHSFYARRLNVLDVIAPRHIDFDWPAGAIVELEEPSLDRLLDGTRAVLILLYTSWCSVCHHMMPEYELVALHYANDRSVVIMRLNVERQPSLVTTLKIDSFPTILFYPRTTNKNMPQTYKGVHTHREMIEFIDAGGRVYDPHQEL